MNPIPSFLHPRVRRAWLSSSLLFLLCLPLTLRAANDWIIVEADVQETPDQIVFSIDALDTGGSDITISRREQGLRGSATWNVQATVPDSTTSWTDDTISRGIIYEYKFYRPANYAENFNDPNAAYVSCGIDVPTVEDRGRVLFIVDSSQATALEKELARMEMDLVGDGWTVIRRNFDRHGIGSPEDLRQLVQNEYAAAGGDLKSLYLFGRLPYVLSGRSAPDGHGAVPHATDMFYADIDGNWTDTYDFGDYSPGDGRYDQNSLPSPGRDVELQTGRVDLAGMTAWSRSETDLLRDYLHKNHNFRHSSYAIPRTGLYSSIYTDDTPIESQAVMAMLGRTNVIEGDFRGPGESSEFLWGIDFSDWNGSNYPNYRFQMMFTLNFGSHKQKWHNSNNPLRAMLCMPQYGLTSVWGARPNWFFHHMGMGSPIGFSHFQTSNNFGSDYNPVDDYGGSMALDVHINLMGDPTLRMHPVIPPGSLNAAVTGGEVQLTWSASSDSNILGYHIYRSSERLGPYTRLNGSLVTSVTEFTDASARSGRVYYMVRALKEEITPVGSYENLSQGVFVTVDADDSVNQAPIANALQTQTIMGLPVDITVTGSDPDTDPILFSPASFPANGTLTGTAPNFVYTPDADFSGQDSFEFSVWDGFTSSKATVTVEVEVPENTAPTANDDPDKFAPNAQPILIDVLANDTDPDGLWQAPPVLNAVETQPSFGTATIEDGQIRYVPTAAITTSTPDTFTYTITDGEALSDPATVFVNGDFDGDGVSDLDEVLAGRNPGGVDRAQVPWTEDFEDRGPGPLADVPGLWTLAPGTGAALVADADNPANRLLHIDSEQEQVELTQYLDVLHPHRVLWTGFSADLAPYANDADDPEIDAEATIAFYLRENGEIRVRDGATWLTLDMGLTPRATHHYTVRKDSFRQTWDLWIDGDLAAENLDFAHNDSGARFFRLIQGQARNSTLDTIRVAPLAPVGLVDGPGHGTYDAWADGIDWQGNSSDPLFHPSGADLNNFGFYAFGLHPILNQADRPVSLQMDATGPWAELVYHRNRQAGDLELVIQSSSDLLEWTDVNPAPADVSIDPVPGDPDTEAVTIRFPLQDGILFHRVRVLGAPE